LAAHRAGLSLGDIAMVLGVSFAGHIGVNHLAYRVGIRDVKW
jgi:hypothetical protein